MFVILMLFYSWSELKSGMVPYTTCKFILDTGKQPKPREFIPLSKDFKTVDRETNCEDSDWSRSALSNH